MSLVNNEELKNLTNTTNGSINKQVVDFAKNILFSQLKSYISDEKQYKIINDKINYVSFYLFLIFFTIILLIHVMTFVFS